MEVREMTLEDEKESLDFSEFDDFWNQKILEEDMQEENTLYYIAKEKEEILGILGVGRIFDTLEIRMIAVKKTKRNAGIGTKLLRYLLQEVEKKEDIQKIELEVRKSNQIALQMYQKQGFIVVGKRQNYYNGQEDAILMNWEKKN